jgi:cytidylate kinase
MEQCGMAATVNGLESALAERDRLDSTREVSPLRKADDAHEVDTSGLTIEDQVERVLELARARMNQQPQP